MVLPLATDAILDLAVLGVVLQEPQPLPVLCAHVQALVAPWLTPTLEVIEGRISRLCVQHQLAMGACSTPDLLLGASEGSALAFARLMERTLPEGHHVPALAAEAVKL